MHTNIKFYEKRIHPSKNLICINVNIRIEN